MRDDFISKMVLKVKLTEKYQKNDGDQAGEWGVMSYRRNDKEKDLRETRGWEALVAKRPTQNKSLSRVKKKRGGEKRMITVSITVSTLQPTNKFIFNMYTTNL